MDMKRIEKRKNMMNEAFDKLSLHFGGSNLTMCGNEIRLRSLGDILVSLNASDCWYIGRVWNEYVDCTLEDVFGDLDCGIYQDHESLMEALEPFDAEALKVELANLYPHRLKVTNAGDLFRHDLCLERLVISGIDGDVNYANWHEKTLTDVEFEFDGCDRVKLTKGNYRKFKDIVVKYFDSLDWNLYEAVTYLNEHSRYKFEVRDGEIYTVDKIYRLVDGLKKPREITSNGRIIKHGVFAQAVDHCKTLEEACRAICKEYPIKWSYFEAVEYLNANSSHHFRESKCDTIVNDNGNSICNMDGTPNMEGYYGSIFNADYTLEEICKVICERFPKVEEVEMTMAEINEALGKVVKVVE